MDQPKIERLLRLMKMLTANNTLTIDEMAEKLNTSPRSVYRYIDTFRDAGFVVKKSGKYIKLDKQSPYFKDISQLVHFTDEEAHILKSAIESIDENNVIKQNLKSKLYSVYDYKILAECVTKGSNARNVNSIVEAIQNKKQIVLRNYKSANSKHISDRIIEPYEFTTNYIQVWGYEIESGVNKLYKISRIGDVEVLSNGWENQKKHQTAYMDIFRYSSFTQHPIKLQLGMRAASLLVEEYPLSEKYLKKISESHYILETDVCSFEGAGRFVLGLLDDIKVLHSPEFVEFLSNRINMFNK